LEGLALASPAWTEGKKSDGGKVVKIAKRTKMNGNESEISEKYKI